MLFQSLVHIFGFTNIYDSLYHLNHFTKQKVNTTGR